MASSSCCKRDIYGESIYPNKLRKIGLGDVLISNELGEISLPQMTGGTDQFLAIDADGNLSTSVITGGGGGAGDVVGPASSTDSAVARFD